MRLLLRFLAGALIAGLLAGCGTSSVIDSYTSSVPTRTPLSGHVYLIRGLIGEVFSRGLDNLAEKINQRGVTATVHSMYASGALADEVIANYRREPGPIILLGHSSGGDVAIDIAKRLRDEHIPVGIIFGFDPTPIAGHVPENVELFINLFQKTNPIGGGVVRSSSGFQGRLINVDLREHSEIIHITLDKSSRIHDLVTDEIVAYVTAAQAMQGAPVAQPVYGQTSPFPQPNYIRPYFLAYVVPQNEPIEIWDSGLQIAIQPGETVQSIAANYRLPIWLIAQVNRLDPNAPLSPGKQLIIPQHMYGNGGFAQAVSSYAR